MQTIDKKDYYRISIWNNFQLHLKIGIKRFILQLSMKWGLIFYLLLTFCPHLCSFCVVSYLRFGQISPLAFFRWLTATLDRNAESCNRIPSNYCLHKNYQDEDKKSAINKKLILRLRSLISKCFQLKTIKYEVFTCLKWLWTLIHWLLKN